MAEHMKPTLEQCKEALRNASGNISTALATLMLACQLQVAQAQTTPVSPSTSASAAADKGGGQVVEIGGKKYSFAEIAGMSSEKQVELLIKTDEKTQNAFGDYLSGRLQAANQRIETKKGVEKAANQEADASAVRKQAAIDEIIKKIPRIIPVYEQQLATGKKLTLDQKETLTYILSINKPPEWMSRVQKLLANPQNFA